MDEQYFEAAEALAEAERNSAMRKAAKAAFSDLLLAPENYKSTECETCGDDLPEYRMQRGCLRCVICQGRLEKYSRVG